jgi:hypothetical protein
MGTPAMACQVAARVGDCWALCSPGELAVGIVLVSSTWRRHHLETLANITIMPNPDSPSPTGGTTRIPAELD